MNEEKKEEQTPSPKQKSTEELLVDKEAELVTLKKQTSELQAQKEHWRTKAEKLEAEIPPPPSDETFSDEGKLLKKDISSLHEKISALEKRDQLREIKLEYPVLADKWDEFSEFLEDEENSRLSPKKVAKLFLVEKGLLQSIPERKGLEKPTGGTKTTTPVGEYTVDEAKRIRESDPKLYEKLVRENRLKIK